MQLKEQVCSLKLAKRLKDLGAKQKSIFQWLRYPHTRAGMQNEWEVVYAKSDNKNPLWVSAFTVAELGEMLPPDTRTVQWLVEGKMYWNVTNIGGLTNINADSVIGEADARAKMLIYLVENQLLKID